MAKTILVITGDGLGHFTLTTDEGVVSLGEDGASAATVLRGLRIERLECVVDAEEPVLVQEPGNGPDDLDVEHRVLSFGEDVQCGRIQFRLEATPDDLQLELATPAPAPARAAVPAPAPTPAAPRLMRLHVVDGADQGRSFMLPEEGIVTIGNSNKTADIVLHDLYVSRVHCELQVRAGRVEVTHIRGENGTRIKGQRITDTEELPLGETMRVGNSYLRLEDISGGTGTEARPSAGTHSTSVDRHTPLPPTKAPPPAPLPSEPWAPREGHVFGHFKIGPVLGRGFAGLVVRAEEIKKRAPVTLKILAPPFYSSPEESKRFTQALATTPHLQHPNLVALHGAGRTESLCWIAREYIDGESAEQQIQRIRESDKPSWKHAVRVATHLAQALAFLHQHKVVHGNVTPNNVLIRSADRLTKLSDLMLMQALEGSKHQITYRDKKLAAELPYLPPEQAEVGAYVDALADLYSLGALSYALVTGRPPFVAATTDELRKQVLKSPVVRPTKLRSGIPPAFEAVIMQLLSKHQEDRYQTADQLLESLRPLTDEHAVKV